MILIYSILFIVLVGSYFVDAQKTKRALRIAWKGFLRLLPPFLQMLIIASFIIYFVPTSVMSKYLGVSSGINSIFIGGFIGSVALVPGFVAYPLTKILIQNGGTYMSGAAFVTTLMMVGIASFPLEKEFFGVRVALIRNIISFFIAITIALFIGMFYGELL